jgi:hypothetical protein
LLQVDEHVQGWASGWVAVGAKRRYVANERSWYSTVRTREHILMVGLGRTRFTLVATSPTEEAGWWYAFVQPAGIREVRTGYVSHGSKALPGLRLCYQPESDEEREERLYLAFADGETTQRVIDDLRLDAAPCVTGDQ